MKYNVLKSYRDYLEMNYSRETAKKYYTKLDNLLEDQSINMIELDFEKIIKKLEQIKYKNYFSQSKNALFHFLRFCEINLNDDYLKYIEYLKFNKKKKYRKLENIDYNQVKRSIERLKNKKLKLSFQTMALTGLRVSELAQITHKDCTISEDEICFSFIGKGGNKEVVTLYKKDNPNIYRNIKEQIENTDKEKCVFYSAVYLQRKAKELGFKCHDLRRAFAKLEYKKSKSKQDVMAKLRHSNIKNTNLYLNSKVKV